MKKLLSLLFTLAIVFSLTMPVFAQDTTAPQEAPKTEKTKKMKKAKAPKKAKKAKETKPAEEAPKQ
jgi:hypothetical protein